MNFTIHCERPKSGCIGHRGTCLGHGLRPIFRLYFAHLGSGLGKWAEIRPELGYFTTWRPWISRAAERPAWPLRLLVRWSLPPRAPVAHGTIPGTWARTESAPPRAR